MQVWDVFQVGSAFSTRIDALEQGSRTCFAGTIQPGSMKRDG